MAVTLSEAAAKQVKELKQAQNLPDTVFLRMGVKGGGCSGCPTPWSSIARWARTIRSS